MSPETIIAAVHEYRARGWAPVPLNGKDPSINGLGWQQRRYQDRHFEGCNVGIILGEPSNGLTDVDLDSAEARKVAYYFLPPTKALQVDSFVIAFTKHLAY